MNRRHVCVMLALGLGLLLLSQLIFPLGGAMGSDFHNAQQDQRNYAAPEKSILPSESAGDCVPSGKPGHDELPPLLLTAGIAFLVRFRIAGWTSGDTCHTTG